MSAHHTAADLPDADEVAPTPGVGQFSATLFVRARTHTALTRQTTHHPRSRK
ncbi:hypothetical protein ACWDG1_37645 [Streptomyces sp. NPDC001177]